MFEGSGLLINKCYSLIIKLKQWKLLMSSVSFFEPREDIKTRNMCVQVDLTRSLC